MRVSERRKQGLAVICVKKMKQTTFANLRHLQEVASNQLFSLKKHTQTTSPPTKMIELCLAKGRQAHCKERVRVHADGGGDRIPAVQNKDQDCAMPKSDGKTPPRNRKKWSQLGESPLNQEKGRVFMAKTSSKKKANGDLNWDGKEGQDLLKKPLVFQLGWSRVWVLKGPPWRRSPWSPWSVSPA